MQFCFLVFLISAVSAGRKHILRYRYPKVLPCNDNQPLNHLDIGQISPELVEYNSYYDATTFDEQLRLEELRHQKRLRRRRKKYKTRRGKGRYTEIPNFSRCQSCGSNSGLPGRPDLQVESGLGGPEFGFGSGATHLKQMSPLKRQPDDTIYNNW